MVLHANFVVPYQANNYGVVFKLDNLLVVVYGCTVIHKIAEDWRRSLEAEVLLPILTTGGLPAGKSIIQVQIGMNKTSWEEIMVLDAEL